MDAGWGLGFGGLSGCGAEFRAVGVCDSGPLRLQDGWHGSRTVAAPHLGLDSPVSAVGQGAVARGLPSPQPPGLISCSRPQGGGAAFRLASQLRVKTLPPQALNIHKKASPRQATPPHSKRLSDFSLLQQEPLRRENPELVTRFLLLANPKVPICICKDEAELASEVTWSRTTEGPRDARVRPKLQWRNRLARGTYIAVQAEQCRGCEFDPHLEQLFFISVF